MNKTVLMKGHKVCFFCIQEYGKSSINYRISSVIRQSFFSSKSIPKILICLLRQSRSLGLLRKEKNLYYNKVSLD